MADGDRCDCSHRGGSSLTVSIIGHCPETGMVGGAITSSSICVASRCLFTRSGVGAVLTQNVTDPSLGKKMLDLLETGMEPEAVLTSLKNSESHLEWRQLAVLDCRGRSACFSGDKALGINHVVPETHCAAAGNLLAHENVIEVMLERFMALEGHLAERLLGALEAGLAAGGEKGPVRSAGIQVSIETDWPVIDLRVDWSDEPIQELRALWARYLPEMDSYLLRSVNPDAAPSYGVPGDP